MKNRIYAAFIVFVFLMGGCVTPQPAEATFTPVEPIEVVETPPPAESGPQSLLELPKPNPQSLRLDLAAKPCSIGWSNSGEYLPCPGSLDDIIDGHISRLETPVINGGILVNLPALLTIPAQPESPFGAIFGKLPPYTVQPGDRFKAVLACADGFPGCNVRYSLEYYTAENQVRKIPGADWQVSYDQNGGYIYADVGLDGLVGHTLQFLLAARDNGDPLDDHALWIQPQIVNDTEPSPIAQEHLAVIETEIVSGSIDFSSAPPYLFDDHLEGTPVAVVLFNAGAPQIFWADTTVDHPKFSLEVVAGSYYVLAYAPGVGDGSYVTVAFTGLESSCGQPMQYIVVQPGEPVTDLLINDWNWTCGGSAERFEKPDEVVIP